MATAYYSDPLAYARPIPLVQAPVAVPFGAASPYGAPVVGAAAPRANDDVRFDCMVSADAQGGFVASCVPHRPVAPGLGVPRTGSAQCIVDPDRNGFEMECDFV
ncbi:Malate/l-lactate dehydrogenase domain-containing protein [Pandoravirus kuranda]|uniref:Malate/l-lactate dehydrogenase domain-containing protein n=1 Tax=Pandoravirus kuranda TaxID=3019033 RepID=A0AA95ECV9_9VIRU|nr:Malate/l-lactate dehydrogenase domain-containing protein [Pandoravirus kuranda]